MAIDERGFNSLTDLDPVLTEIFYQDYGQIQPSLLNRVIGVRSSTKSKETHRRIGSFGDPQPWAGQVHYDDADPDYQIEWQHDHLTLGYQVTQEMFEDKQYAEIFNGVGALAQSFARKIVKDEASSFNNAFTAGATAGYDGVALVSATHPRSQTDATTVSNYLGAKALTDANLEEAIVQLEGLKDDRGEETTAMATLLVAGRSQRQTALKLTGSTLEPETGNNAVNTHTNLVPLIHPLISGKKWFVVDGPAALKMMIWYWRIQPAFAADQDLSTTLVRKYFGRMRYSFGWQDFRWVVGSNPA